MALGCGEPGPRECGRHPPRERAPRSGHYFNPRAQRIIEGTHDGAKLIVFDVRLSNTATHADHWLAPYPGSEAAILLAIASFLIRTGRYDRDFVRRWWNWKEYMAAEKPEAKPTFDRFEGFLDELYRGYTFAYAEKDAGGRVPLATFGVER